MCRTHNRNRNYFAQAVNSIIHSGKCILDYSDRRTWSLFNDNAKIESVSSKIQEA